MDALENDIRLLVYRRFVANSHSPSTRQIAKALDADVEAVHGALDRLAADHVLVLHPGTHDIWMAMPFSAVPTAHEVRVGSSTWWANCAWDALGIPAMLGADATIRFRCPVRSQTLPVRLADGQPQTGAPDLATQDSRRGPGALRRPGNDLGLLGS